MDNTGSHQCLTFIMKGCVFLMELWTGGRIFSRFSSDTLHTANLRTTDNTAGFFFFGNPLYLCSSTNYNAICTTAICTRYICWYTCDLVLDGILNPHNSTTPHTRTSDWFFFWQFKELILADNEFYRSIAIIMLWIWDSQWGHFQLSCGWVGPQRKINRVGFEHKDFYDLSWNWTFSFMFFHNYCYKSKV